MPTKIETETAVYPVIRFIHVDLNTSVSRFANKYNRRPSAINNWPGRGKEHKNMKYFQELPIWVPLFFAMEKNWSLDDVFEKLNDYERDWQRDNRFYSMRDGYLKPVSVNDYVALKLGQAYHVESHEDYGLNTTDGWFKDIIVEVNRDMDGTNEDSVMVYRNDDDQELLMTFTNDDFELNDEEEIADKIIAKLRHNLD